MYQTWLRHDPAVALKFVGAYPQATDEEIERIRELTAAYCSSELAARVASLPGARAERPFAFEHDDVLFHGRIDVLQLSGGRAIVVDYKTNILEDRAPEDVVDSEYRIQRLVYAIACLRAGADDVEVVHQFLERPDALVSASFARSDLGGLEAELSAAIAHIQAGEFRPTPGEMDAAKGSSFTNLQGTMAAVQPVAGKLGDRSCF